jgi:pilus assembly protein CpaB
MSPSPATSKQPAQRPSEKTQLAVVLGVAVLFGLIASLATFRFLREKERAVTTGADAPMAQLVVARQDLSAGSTINRLNLETIPWPREHVPLKSFQDMDQVVGRQVTGKIFRGEPIVESRLVAQGEAGSLQFRIPDGYLAMSMKVSPEIGVSGFIEPGNRVDVITTIRVQRGEPVTKVVLQNILVLAVGHEIEEKDNKPDEAPTVTMAVTPEQAEKLAAAKSEGTVVLALRNLRDQKFYDTPGFSSAELIKVRRVLTKAPSAGDEDDEEELAGEDEEEASAADSDAVAKARAALAKRRARKGKGKGQEAAPADGERKVRVVELIQAGTVSEVKFQGQ